MNSQQTPESPQIQTSKWRWVILAVVLQIVLWAVVLMLIIGSAATGFLNSVRQPTHSNVKVTVIKNVVSLDTNTNPTASTA